MKTHKPKTIQKAIDDLQTFLESDMPSMIFPEEKVLGKDWVRTDQFRNREEVKNYLRGHFKILDKQIKRLLKQKINK